MYYNIKVDRQKDPLNRERWNFYIYFDYLALVLTEYVKENRPTTRHKFRVIEGWDAYRDGRVSYPIYARKLDTVPIPDDVKNEALQYIISRLRVVKSFEEVRASSPERI